LRSLALRSLALLPSLLLIAATTVATMPDVAGLEQSSEVQRFGPENLWEYINGGAEVFVQYGFQQLEVADYSSDDLSFTLSLYDMGSALGAFGMLDKEASEKTTMLEIGGLAVVSPPYQALLFKDRWYVKLEVLEGELSPETGAETLTRVAEALPGEDGLPAELQRLPQSELVPGSQSFVAEGYLGLSELRRCVFARYLDSDGVEYQVFTVVPAEDATAEETWKSLETRWTRIDQEARVVLARMVPYSGLAGVTRGSSGELIGVAGCKSKEALLQRLAQLTG
jgi:hypothetical protein